MKLNKIHHVAVICSDYEQSKQFYTEVLGLKIVSEHYRENRQSWKADCWLGDTYVVELFSFPNPPARPSYPEAAGLRHLAFEVDNLAAAVCELDSKGVKHEPIRTDEYTGKQLHHHLKNSIPGEVEIVTILFGFGRPCLLTVLFMSLLLAVIFHILRNSHCFLNLTCTVSNKIT